MCHFNIIICNYIQTFTVCASIKINSNATIRGNVIMVMHVEEYVTGSNWHPQQNSVIANAG